MRNNKAANLVKKSFIWAFAAVFSLSIAGCGRKEALPETAKEARSADAYTISAEVTLKGGSGKATVLSPATVTVTDKGMCARIEWNSPNYDYMIVDGEKYLPVNQDGNSVFEIPVSALDTKIDVIGDTVAMSTPHEIEYTLIFHQDTKKETVTGAEPIEEQAEEIFTDTECGDLVYKSSLELEYAENFSVDYYEGGYTRLTIKDGTRLLTVPEDKDIPQGIDEDIIIMKRPIENIYLVASAVMDMFDKLNAVDAITLSGQKEEGWYIEAARQAMADGHMLYAGKYNQPDYELIVSNNCSLAIENMMVSHSPEVIEMLQDFGIPVIIEYSSYESHPLGRVEWIKFFGALTGKDEEAEQIYDKQSEILKEILDKEKLNNTKKTVAFFYITSNGLIQVRQSSDYIPKMIELAGGSYIFGQFRDDVLSGSTMNMQAEEFYNDAKDADFLIYNSAIDGGVETTKQLIDKCGLLEDFKAVKEGNVWCTSNNMYQNSMSIGYMIKDIYEMLNGGTEDNMEYLVKVK